MKRIRKKPDLYRTPECVVWEIISDQMLALSGSIDGFDELDDYSLS
jgi:hypothetical protein